MEKDMEAQGWDDGALFAAGIQVEVEKELATLRRLNYPPEYIDAWKDSAGSIFYTLTSESK